MRLSTAQYLEKEIVTVSIRNNETSVAILDGQPVYFDGADVSSVNLGVDVKGYATTSSGLTMLVGIAKTQKVGGLVAGDVGEAIVYGFTDAIVVRRVRANSTIAWPTAPALGVGDQFVPETGNNGFTYSATQAVGANMINFAAGQTYASAATLATSDNTGAASGFSAKTASTVRMKVFVRCM
jgi:hypothetical protein